MTYKNNEKIPDQGIKRRWLSVSNLGTALMLVFFLAMLLSPNFKGLVIQSLMKIGLFQPDIPNVKEKEKKSALVSPIGDFKLMDVGGNQFQLSSLKGKVVFLNFWATWCPPCIAEMPSINELRKKYKNSTKIAFLMIDVNSNVEKSKAFIKKNNYNLPVHIAASKIPKDFFSGSMPTTVILNKSGNIIYHHIGGADYNNPEFVDFIDELIN